MTDLINPAQVKRNELQIANKTQRIHGIDALRAIAMLLGVLFHATIAYKIIKVPGWPQDPGYHRWGFDFTYFIIHSFRMPLFFLIAGYFCRFLYYKIGEREFIKHRSKRILAPFLASLVFILPFTIFPFLLNTYSSIYPGQWQKILQASWKQLFHWNGIAHLWFLYYLLIYYCLIVALLRLQKIKIFSGVLTQLKRVSFLAEPKNLIGITVTVLSVWAVLAMVPELYLNVDTGILPGLPYLLFYAVFFAFGWILNRMTSPFFIMTKYLWWFLFFSIALNIGLFIGEFNGAFENLSELKMLLLKLLVATQIIFMVYGITGLFLRYFKSESRSWRYISDASYWIYLVHLGIIAGLQVLFINIKSMPGGVKFPLVLAITVLLTTITYHYWVRYTFIGEYLHGKRKHKGVPEQRKQNKI